MKFLQKYWPVVFFLFILLFYSYPYLILAKIPFPSSFIANNIAPWNNYFSGSPVKNGIPDVPGEIYPMRSLVLDFWQKGIIPLWNPYIFSGTPLLANFQAAAFWPLNIILLLLPRIDGWSILVLLQPFFAGLFLYLYCRQMSFSKIGAVFSSVSFMFCGYLTTWGSYLTMGYSLLFLPLLMFLIEKYYSRKNTIYLFFIPIILAFSFFSGHIQTWFYVFTSSFAYLIARFLFVDRKNIKVFFIILISFSLSLPLVALQLLPTLEFYQLTSRSLLHNNPDQVGIPINYLITFIAPDFFGNPVTRNDWFGTYAEWSGYVGLTALVFSIVGISFIYKNGGMRPIVILLLLGIILSVQNPLLRLLTQLPLPIISNSNPSRAIAILSISVSLLAGFGFEKMVNKMSDIKKPLFIALTSVSLIIVILLVLAIFGSNFLTANINTYLYTVSLRNLFLPLIVTLGLWLLYIGIVIKPQYKKLIVAGFLLILTLEMLRFYQKWTPFDSRDVFYGSTKVTEYLKHRSIPERFYGQFGQTAAYLNKIYSIEGYEPLNLADYSKLIVAASDGKMNNDYWLEVKLQSKEKHTKRLLDLLGVGYLVYNTEDARSPFVFPVWEFPPDTFPLVFKDDKYLVLKNKDSLGKVKLFNDFILFSNHDQAFKKVFEADFDYKNKLTLEQAPELLIDNTAKGEIKIIEYSAQKISLNLKTTGNMLLFVNDNYYPGWKGIINGDPAPIIRANYTFRAIAVPKGESQLILIYDPASFRYGLVISVITLFVLIIGIIFHKKFK